MGLVIKTNNFAIEAMVILRFESIRPRDHVAKIGLNGPMPNRVEVKNFFGVDSYRLTFFVF